MELFFWLSLLIRLVGMVFCGAGIALCAVYYVCDAEKYGFLKCRSVETARYLFINVVLMVFLVIAFFAETSIIDRFEGLKRNAMFIRTFYGRGLLYIFVGAMMMPPYDIQQVNLYVGIAFCVLGFLNFLFFCKAPEDRRDLYHAPDAALRSMYSPPTSAVAGGAGTPTVPTR